MIALREERAVVEAALWSSTMEDSPFAVKDWESLSSSATARREGEEVVREHRRALGGLVSGMRGWRRGTRSAFGDTCDTAPLCREVELLRAVVDGIWAADQSAHCAVAQSLELEADRLESETLRWLREGGRWEYEPGTLPIWQEPALEFLAEPWPVREARGTLGPRGQTAYFELMRRVRHVVGKDRPMRTSLTGIVLGRSVAEGRFYEACELVHDSCLDAAQSANIWLSARLERALDGVEAAVRGLWEDGSWEPPPRPRLICGEFWESGGS